jgi:hypothetical protein
MNSIEVAATQGDFGIENAKIIASGAHERSVLVHRLELSGPGKVPPLGTTRPHPQMVNFIKLWITRGIGMGIPDPDKDGWANNTDNCPNVHNTTQLDSNGDADGNACEP